MSSLKNVWGLAATLAVIAIIYSLLPLGTAVQFGGDEGYQLMASFLMSKGFALYMQIWNDQPPLLVLLLDWSFKLFGPSILVARLMAAGFGLVLFGAFFQLVNQRVNRGAAFFATFLLLASPVILQISVSVMQEVPTFALALVSVLLLFRWLKKPHWGWLLASGAVMGLALEMKLTAVLVVPAMFVEMFLKVQNKRDPDWMKKFCVSIIQWSAATGIVFAIIALIWGQGSFQSSYRSHFAEHAVAGMKQPKDFPFQTTVLSDHIEGVIAAVAGLLLVIHRRRLRDFAFPIAMLVTVICVHAVHRQWWMYYYLHLAIPMAWLAGYAISESISKTLEFFSNNKFSLSSQKTWGIIAFCILALLALVQSEKRLEGGIKELRQRERVETSSVIAVMRQYADRTHWIYVQYGYEIFPFHARLQMPPEIATVTLKRFWSDQISTTEIVETCKRYKVEQILLKPTTVKGEWIEFLKSDYYAVYQNQDWILYVTKGIAPENRPNRPSGILPLH